MTALNTSQNLGAALLGLVVSTILFGMAILQTYVYFFAKNRNDLPVLKYTITAICFFNASFVLFSVQMVYTYVTQTLDGLDMLTTTWNLKTLGAIQTLVIWLVQSVYLFHIWKLRRESRGGNSLVVFLAAVGVCSLLAGIIYVTALAMVSNLQELTNFEIRWLISTSGILTAFIDTIIAFTMTLTLRSHTSGIARTNRILLKLYIYFHITGILTSMSSITATALYLAFPENLAFLATDFCITQVYTLSLLILLNTRQDLRNELSEPLTLNLSALSVVPRNFGRDPALKSDPEMGRFPGVASTVMGSGGTSHHYQDSMASTLDLH